MKENTTNIQNPGSLSTEDKISFGHLALFVALLPFHRIYTELVLISLLLHTVIHLRKNRFTQILNMQTLILSAVFLLNLVCLTWSPDKKEGINYLLRQLAILLFPLIFAATGLSIGKNRRLLLHIFGLTCIFTLLYLYADALRVILYFGLPLKSLLSQSFINHNFSGPIGLHATYLSAFVSLAAISFLYFLIKEEKRKRQLLYIAGLLILFAGLIQLSSRSVLIAFLVVTAVVFPFFIPKGKKRMRFIVLASACSLIALLGIIKSDSLKKRYVAELKTDLTQKSINNELIESRVTRWKAILPLTQHHLVIGHGTGSEKKLLQETYFRNKLYNSYLNELNTHNQYLKFLLESGIPGLLLFLTTLLWGIAFAVKNRDVIFLSFMITVVIVCFSENMLDVNKGIFFYSFFFSFFAKSSKPSTGILRFTGKDQQ